MLELNRKSRKLFKINAIDIFNNICVILIFIDTTLEYFILKWTHINVRMKKIRIMCIEL